jgi:hypothetical protein
MMSTRDASSENDVLYEFALGYEHPDPQRLDEFVRAHPTYAEELTTLAIELAIERTGDNEPVVSEELDPKAEALLSKAMSHLQNRLYGIRTAHASAGPETSRTKPRDLFGSRSREQMRELTINLQVSPLFVRRLRDCEIRADTMTPGFVREVAEVMKEPQTDVSHYFAKTTPQLSRHEFYKSEVTPTVGRQITFEEAVRSSGLTAEQQARLLAL